MQIDWLRASREERKILYKISKDIRDRHFKDWHDFYKTVLGWTPPKSAFYEDSFRAGKISRKKACGIAGWIEQRQPEHYKKLMAGIAELHGNVQAQTGWADFLRNHGRYGHADVVLLPEKPIGIVAFADLEPVSDKIIKRGQNFCFTLDCGMDGQVLAFQNFGGLWYPLPLQVGGMSMAIRSGTQILPRDAVTNAPIALWEATDMGKHRFVFLVTDSELTKTLEKDLKAGQTIPPAILDSIAASVLQNPTNTWQAYRVNVRFVG